MKRSLLLPHRWKMVGWCMLAVAFVGHALTYISGDTPDWEVPVFNLHRSAFLGGDNEMGPGFYTDNIYLSVVAIVVIVGAILVGFSREKQEDEFIARLRLTSLQWAVLLNQLLLVCCILFLWGWDFFQVMTFNVVTTPLIFIIRFNYLLLRNEKQARHEK